MTSSYVSSMLCAVVDATDNAPFKSLISADFNLCSKYVLGLSLI